MKLMLKASTLCHVIKDDQFLVLVSSKWLKVMKETCKMTTNHSEPGTHWCYSREQLNFHLFTVRF